MSNLKVSNDLIPADVTNNSVEKSGKKPKKAPALVRMIGDAAIVLHMEDDKDLPVLLEEAKDLRRASYQKLESPKAKKVALKLGEGLEKIEEKIKKDLKELMDEETDSGEEGANLKKMKKMVREVASTLKFLGNGKYTYIPYKYKGKKTESNNSVEKYFSILPDCSSFFLVADALIVEGRLKRGEGWGATRSQTSFSLLPRIGLSVMMKDDLGLGGGKGEREHEIRC